MQNADEGNTSETTPDPILDGSLPSRVIEDIGNRLDGLAISPGAIQDYRHLVQELRRNVQTVRETWDAIQLHLSTADYNHVHADFIGLDYARIDYILYGHLQMAEFSALQYPSRRVHDGPETS